MSSSGRGGPHGRRTLDISLARAASPQDVLRVRQADLCALSELLTAYGMALKLIADGHAIPGSFWGDSEAGLIGDTLFARGDTPVHSVLHEAGHYVCMSPARRAGLHTDAGGGCAEESAVCYLQIKLADYLPGVGAEQLMADMDAWGYSFRLGGAREWFERDAEDARAWLQARGLIDAASRPTWHLRGPPSG